MDINKIRERALSAPTINEAKDFLEWSYWFSHITATEYNKLKTEIYKQWQ